MRWLVVVSTSPYNIAALLYAVILMYVLALMLAVVGSIYFLCTGERPWWHAMLGGGALLLTVFLVQLLPIRIGTVMMLNGIMLTVVGGFVMRLAKWWYRGRQQTGD